MDELFGEWWWCPECGEPIELCSSYGDCPNNAISKSHVTAEQSRAADSSICLSCGHMDGYHPIWCMAGE